MFPHSLFKLLHLMGEAFAAGAGTKFFWATTRVRDKELTFFICITMLTELSTHGIMGTRYKNLVPLRWTGRFIRVTLIWPMFNWALGPLDQSVKIAMVLGPGPIFK